jgi:hypothetical protein
VAQPCRPKPPVETEKRHRLIEVPDLQSSFSYLPSHGHLRGSPGFSSPSQPLDQSAGRVSAMGLFYQPCTRHWAVLPAVRQPLQSTNACRTPTSAVEERSSTDASSDHPLALSLLYASPASTSRRACEWSDLSSCDLREIPRVALCPCLIPLAKTGGRTGDRGEISLSDRPLCVY